MDSALEEVAGDRGNAATRSNILSKAVHYWPIVSVSGLEATRRPPWRV